MVSSEGAGDGPGGVVGVPSGTIPSNKSNQKLVNEDYLESGRSSNQELSSSPSSSDMRRASSREPVSQDCRITRSQWLTVIVLLYVNLINYMDRFTLAGE